MLPITELSGRYQLEELIAAGGMGEVWRGLDRVLARPVAVKLLRPEYTRDEVTLLRFRAEAQHGGLLSHPGIAQVYDYRDASPECPAYLVMELVTGSSLAAVLAAGRLEPRRTADVVGQAALALHAAHAAGVLHRDIKPGNLLISRDGQVKVTDFGIAQSSRTENLTSTGALIGTMGYLAPERVSGGSATVASDLYALGIVAYECLTGQPPFRGEPLQVALAHRDQALPGLPPWCLHQPGGTELAALIASLTAKDPAARPATAAEVAGRARRIADGLAAWPGGPAAPTGPDRTLAFPAARPGSARPGSAPPGTPSGEPPGGTPGGPPRRWRVAVGLPCGILVAALLGWLVATAQSHPAQPGGTPGPHHQAAPTPSSVSVRTVNVSPALLGRPVNVVGRELRGLGLVVQVRLRPDRQAAPGSVLWIYPTGRVQEGSVVLLTVATRSTPSAATSQGTSATTAGGGHGSPGRTKHRKGPPPGHG